MQTNAIGRSAAPTADIKAWLAEKAQQFSTWLNSESSKFNLWQGNFSAKVLPVQEKCLPLPTVTNRESIHAVGHRSIVQHQVRGHFLCPHYDHIGGCHSVNQFCPTGEVTICYQRDVQPPFSVSAPGGSRYGNKSCNMQTNATIGRSAAPTADIKAWLAVRKSRVNEWLDGQSKYFSRLAGFAVTRRTVIRMNAIAALAGLAALCVEGAPLAAAVSAVCAAAMSYKLNRDERKGGER